MLNYKLLYKILLFAFISIGLGLGETKANMIDSFVSLPIDKQDAEIYPFLTKIINYNTDSSLILLEQLAKDIKQNDSKAIVAVYTHIAGIYSKKLDSVQFNRYYNMARISAIRNNYHSELGKLYILKAEDFKSKSIMDSSMYYCLIARDVYSDNNLKYEMAEANHTMGDIYYWLEMYDKARTYYQKIIDIGDKAPYWKEWRKIVVFSNIGNILTYSKDYSNALAYYKQAERQIYENRKSQSKNSENIQLAHLYNRIANCYQLDNQLDSAKFYIDSAIVCLNNEPSLKSIYSYIYLYAGEIYSKLNKSKIAEEYFSIAINSIRIARRSNLSEAYLGIADHYQRFGNFPLAYKYMLLYADENQKSKSLKNSAKILQYKVTQDYSKLENTIAQQNFQLSMYLATIILLVILIISIIYFRNKLKTLSKYLIKSTFIRIENRKSKHIADVKLHQNDIYIDDPLQFAPKIIDFTAEQITVTNEISLEEAEVDDSHSHNLHLSPELKELALRINDLLADNPIVFQTEFSINDLAKLMNSNRDYISKAINGYFGTSFQIYINELRVVEVIKLMKNNGERNMKMEFFMEKTGFTNRVTFTNSFKRYTGITPSVFYKSIYQ